MNHQLSTPGTGGRYGTHGLAAAARPAPKINHAAMNAAADRVVGRPMTFARHVGCGCGQPRLKDLELPDGCWLARCGCGRQGRGETLAAARAEMEGR